MSVFDNDASTYDQRYTTPMGRHADDVETSCAFALLQPLVVFSLGNEEFGIDISRGRGRSFPSRPLQYKRFDIGR